LKFISFEKISRQESRKVLLILFGTIAVSFISVIFYPLDLLNKVFPGLFREDSSCIMLNVFNIPCPFCGMSRAFAELLNLNFAKSFYYNPSSVFFFAFLGLLFTAIFVLSLFNYKMKFNFNKKTLFAFIFVTIIIWFLNIFFGHH